MNKEPLVLSLLLFFCGPANALSLMPIVPAGLGKGSSAWCFQWTDSRKKDGSETNPYTQWVLGYVSGWMSTRRQDQKTVDQNETDELLDAIDHRCEANPNSPLPVELGRFLFNRFEKHP